jgi:hypothetical protein|tara:strand:+ start:78 stop:233 length:156 start_codon:yes stop_codon:yes gene_type:complete
MAQLNEQDLQRLKDNGYTKKEIVKPRAAEDLDPDQYGVPISMFLDLEDKDE